MAHSFYIIVVGCGRLGGILASYLSGYGHRVVAIDNQANAFEKLSNEFSGFTILGDAVEPAVLREANSEDADYLFATTSLDNVNLMVAQIAKSIYDVPKVVARVFDPQRENIYAEFGIETISPVELSAEAFIATCGDLASGGGKIC
ncbi:MAG: potassium channel family protein [Anaerolineales bacterium]